MTDQENRIVDEALTRRQAGIASQFKKVTVDYKDICRLKPETWLNDEIINFYFELLSERQTAQKDLPSIYCFSSFFCSTLRDQGFAKVKRWTKRVGFLLYKTMVLLILLVRLTYSPKISYLYQLINHIIGYLV